MSGFKEVDAEWDFDLFDCLESPIMFLWALFVPCGGACMQGYAAKAADPLNPHACQVACCCEAFLCCIGSVFNAERLARNLHLKFSWLAAFIESLLCCLSSCGNTQDWMQTMLKVKGNHKITIWEFHETDGFNLK